MTKFRTFLLIVLSFCVSCGRPLNDGDNGSNGDTNDNGNTGQENLNACGVQIQSSQSFTETSLVFHQTGMDAFTSWLANNTFPSGFLSFGPYTKSLSPYMNQATFNLSFSTTDAIDPTRVASIEVYDNINGAIYASQSLYRNSFSGSGVQAFTLNWYNPNECGNGIEGRVGWIDNPETAPNTSTFTETTLSFSYVGQIDYGFDGSNYLPVRDNVFNDLNTVGFAAWIKTSSPGVILGQQFTPPNTSVPPGTSWVPILYVGTDGKLHGSVWDNPALGTVPNMVSSASVNDNNWHHVAIVADSSGTPFQKLYLDGQVVGQRNNPIVVGQGAYTQIGLGYLTSGWPATNTGWSYFNGSMRATRTWITGGITDQVVSTIYNNGP